MPISPDSIQDETSTLPANSEAAPADKDTPKIPDSVLEIPLMRGMLEGAPAAVFAPVGTKTPEVATILKHGKEMNAAGFGFFRDTANKLDVFWNRRFITPELIEAAAKKGKIPEIASPLIETLAQFNGAVEGTAGIAPSAGGVPSPTPVDSALNTQRVDNLTPGGPTSGNFPGAGRVLNGILTQTV